MTAGRHSTFRIVVSAVLQLPEGIAGSREAALAPAQGCQHFHARIAVGIQALLCLERLDGLPRAFTDAPVGLAVIVAVGGEALLQFLALGKGELGEWPLPVLNQPVRAGD